MNSFRTNSLIGNRKDSTILFRIIMLFRLFTGHYYEWENSKLFKLLKLTYCLLYSGEIAVASIRYWTVTPIDGRLFLTAEFFCGTLTSMFFEKSILKFITSIHKIDYLLGCKSVLVSKRTIFISLFFLFYIALTILLYYINNYPLLIVFYATPISLSLVFSYLPHIILLDLMYIRMKSLRMLFQREFMKFNVIGIEQIEIKIKNIKNCLVIYKTMLNDFSKASKEIQLGLMIILVTCYPQMIFYVYEAISLYNKKSHLKAIQPCIKIIQTLTLLFIPAVISEMINNEYEKILKTLWRQILLCTDEALLLETQQAYLYMKLRPFKITIWRAIQLNLSMPISYISVCISHLIVVIQFTNVHKTHN